MPQRLVILRLSGDFYTKASRTRARFARRLARNLRDALESSGIPHRLIRTWSRLYLETDRPEETLDVLPRVFGLHSLSVAERRQWESLEDVVCQGEALFATGVAGRRFAVRCRRRGDRNLIPFTSIDVERRLGARLLPCSGGVDLDHPEVTVHLEIDTSGADFFTRKVPGPRGLPIGVEGRAVALLSGGFDSAVAAWLMLKRGVAVDYLFLNLGGDVHRRGVLEVAKILADRWSYGTRPRLFELDFRPLITELQANTRPSHWQILLKRFMLRAGERLARHIRASGTVTGDAIGQVSSQTLPNLAVISEVAALPVLRPLLGFNKEEILADCRRIGVYEAAAAVSEYCALAARRPATRASARAVAAEEAKLDLARLEEMLSPRAARVYSLRALDLAEYRQDPLHTDHIPEGAVVVDLRPKAAFAAWHAAGALHLDFAHTLRAYRSFDRRRTYVLYCEVGLKSAHLAGLMREAGFDAHHVSGGAKQLASIEAGEGRTLAVTAVEDR